MVRRGAVTRSPSLPPPIFSNLQSHKPPSFFLVASSLRMSLNLISSLSFLKSKLGAKTPATGSKRTSRLDLFAGITESDLDSSSSESEDESTRDSSRCVSPASPGLDRKAAGSGSSCSGRVKGAAAPTADILQKCLDILNSDISDSETLPQPDVINETTKPETEMFEEKKIVKQACAAPSSRSSPTNPTPNVFSPAFTQGLLKIASPRREDVNSAIQQTHKSAAFCKDSFQPLSVSVSSSVGRAGDRGGVASPSASPSPPPPGDHASAAAVDSSDTEDYPGPPELEPMVSIARTTGHHTMTTSNASSTKSLASLPVNTVHSTSQPLPALKTPTPLMAAAAPTVEKILLPPVPAGQTQQIILQPPLLNQQHQVIQQQQSFLGPGVPTVQIVQTGVPIQLTAGPIPLLSASGQLLGTLGGVNNQTTLLNNLQSFTALLQQNQNNSLSSRGGVVAPPQPGLNNPAVSGLNPATLFTQSSLISQPKMLPMINIKQEPVSSSAAAAASLVAPQLVSMTGINQNFAPSFPLSSNNLPTSGGPIMLSSAQQQIVPGLAASLHASPVVASSRQQTLYNGPTHTAAAALPVICSSRSQSIVPSSFSNPQALSHITSLTTSTNQSPAASMTSASFIVKTEPAPPCSQATSSAVLTGPPSTTTSNLNSSMARLVQDPATGLYNLVSSPEPAKAAALPPQPPAAVTPLNLGLALPGSPKRVGSPLSSSPNKAAKLLLPTLAQAKENPPAGTDPPTTKYMCGVCNKFFGNTKNLRVHISEIHEGKRGQFPCDICHKVFPRKRNMERHKNALHLKNNPVCPLCQKVVVNIEVHVKRFHRGSEELSKVSAATA